MRLALAILFGRVVRYLARLRGGGSAIPGRIAMLIEPRILEKTLGSLTHGAVFVSGSNGKSTTTALVTAVLRSQGLRVFSNPSGGNMPQGIASAVVGKSNLRGDLVADVAVLEVDEAYGSVISRHLMPSWVVLTNIQIDQLNRFFDPERVAEMLSSFARLASAGVVINGTDANLVDLGLEISNQVKVSQVSATKAALSKWPEGALAAPRFGKAIAKNSLPIISEVISEGDSTSEIKVGSHQALVCLPGNGLHFALDTALALGLGVELVGSGFSLEKAVEALSRQDTVYGRGEIVTHRGQEIQILMMKNPSSFRATLVAMEKTDVEVWFAMDEGTPDPSWLYDIDLSKISGVRVTSGSRCWHLATRFSYEGIGVHSVLPDSKAALEHYVDYLAGVSKRGILITNYEQMMVIRKLMGFLDLESGK
jgi:lipid II isoglutaminyl synthase (glutamine-hydrolysing)